MSRTDHHRRVVENDEGQKFWRGHPFESLHRDPNATYGLDRGRLYPSAREAIVADLAAEDDAPVRRGVKRDRKAADQRKSARKDVIKRVDLDFEYADNALECGQRDLVVGYLEHCPCGGEEHNITRDLLADCPCYGLMTEAMVIAAWRQVWRTQDASRRYRESA